MGEQISKDDCPKLYKIEEIKIKGRDPGRRYDRGRMLMFDYSSGCHNGSDPLEIYDAIFGENTAAEEIKRIEEEAERKIKRKEEEAEQFRIMTFYWKGAIEDAVKKAKKGDGEMHNRMWKQCYDRNAQYNYEKQDKPSPNGDYYANTSGGQNGDDYFLEINEIIQKKKLSTFTLLRLKPEEFWDRHKYDTRCSTNKRCQVSERMGDGNIPVTRLQRRDPDPTKYPIKNDVLKIFVPETFDQKYNLEVCQPPGVWKLEKRTGMFWEDMKHKLTYDEFTKERKSGREVNCYLLNDITKLMHHLDQPPRCDTLVFKLTKKEKVGFWGRTETTNEKFRFAVKVL